MSPENAAKPKLLVVEDNQVVMQQYIMGFDAAPFEVRYASDGEQALKAYRQWQPDLILLDIMLPHLSGYSVLKTIRSELEDQQTRVVMATALSTKEDIMACAELGISGYIVKPFKVKEIEGLVMSYLRN